jgi:hypothetical protein
MASSGPHTAVDAAMYWKARAEKLQAALERCLITCEHLSHRKGEFHDWPAECPVEKLVRNALNRTTSE